MLYAILCYDREDVVEAFSAAEKDWDLAIIDEAHGYTLQVNGKGLISKRSERWPSKSGLRR